MTEKKSPRSDHIYFVEVWVSYRDKLMKRGLHFDVAGVISWEWIDSLTDEEFENVCLAVMMERGKW
jgi:hypothetical protein